MEEWLETPDDATAVGDVMAVATANLPPPQGDLNPPEHRVARYNAKTVITVNGYPFKRYHKSSIKLSFRCSPFRTSKCKAKVYFNVGASRYDLFGEYKCSARFDARTPVTDVSAGTRDVTDRLAVTDTSMPPEEIWRLMRERYYLGNTDEVLPGSTREQVKRRMHRVRHTHYGGNYHGVVEVPPLSLTLVGGFPFFKFHQVYMDGVNLERVIGWARPVLHERLKCKNSSLFIDGTFRCVPHGFYQCFIVMVHDFATALFLPVFFVLCTSKTQDMYWNVINAVVIACNEKLLSETVVCDFESALIDAESVQFKDARVVGCYFYFKQTCMRYMETKVMIASDAVKIAMAPGFLDLLTVIPQHKIGGPGVRCVTRKFEARCLELSVVYSRMKWEKFWRNYKKT